MFSCPCKSLGDLEKQPDIFEPFVGVTWWPLKDSRGGLA